MPHPEAVSGPLPVCCPRSYLYHHGLTWNMDRPPGRRDISRIVNHISSSPQDTPVQEVFS